MKTIQENLAQLLAKKLNVKQEVSSKLVAIIAKNHVNTSVAECIQENTDQCK